MVVLGGGAVSYERGTPVHSAGGSRDGLVAREMRGGVERPSWRIGFRSSDPDVSFDYVNVQNRDWRENGPMQGNLAHKKSPHPSTIQQVYA